MLLGGDRVPGYVAAEAELIRLTEAMAIELAPQGMRVNALATGYVQNDMSAAFFVSYPGRAALERMPEWTARFAPGTVQASATSRRRFGRLSQRCRSRRR